MRAVGAVCLPRLASDGHATPRSLRPAAVNTPVQVRIGELVHEARSDFAAGQTQGVDLPRAGAERGLAAGPEGGLYTSASLETEFAASHVGLHWLAEGEIGFELRASRDGSRWARWQRVFLESGKDENPRAETFGALVGSRSARYLQYRATFPPSPEVNKRTQLFRLTLTYLDAQPRGPGPVVHAGLLLGPADFRSQVVTREAWGADDSLRFTADGSEIWPRAYVPAKKIVVHHTAGANDYSDGAAEVRAVYTYHARTLGWGDIGYHLLIDSSGQVYEGRRGRDEDPQVRLTGSGREVASRDVVAGHATSFNYGTASIALLGNFQEAPLPEVMRRRLEDALVFECDRYGVDPLWVSDFLLSNEFWRENLADVPGHRDCTPTECPGDFVYQRLPEIRRAVAERLSLRDSPPVGPVALEQGRNAWPGRLDFSWRGLPGAQFSTVLEGWLREPGRDEVLELSGYEAGTSMPAWGEWSRATSATFDIPPDRHGHYTLHVRTRTAPGVEGAAWGRFSALVEPQLPVDNDDPALASTEGEWALSTEPRDYYGRDFAYALAGGGERTFHWRLAAPGSGRYAVQACWTSLADFAASAPFRVTVEGETVARVEADQTRNAFTWRTLAELDLREGQVCEVALSNAADGTVVADAVRLVLQRRYTSLSNPRAPAVA